MLKIDDIKRNGLSMPSWQHEKDDENGKDIEEND